MNKLAKKIKARERVGQLDETFSLKSEFIQRIIKARNLSEDSVTNLLSSLEGTYAEGLQLTALKERMRHTISSGGGKKKAKQSQTIDEFAKRMCAQHPEKFRFYSSILLARFLIKTYGADQVGAEGPLRRKIAKWKKENNTVGQVLSK